MKCSHCGTSVDDQSEVCPYCRRTVRDETGDGRQDDERRSEVQRGWEAGARERAPKGGREESGRSDGSSLQDANGKLDFPVKFPQSGGWRPVGIAGLMLLLSFLVAPLFVLAGYCSRVCRAAARGAEEPPAFDDWGGLLKEGVLWSIAVLGFTILLGVVVAILYFAADATGLAGIGGLAILTYVLGLYATRAVMTLYAVTLDFRATFSASNIWTLTFSVDYLVTFLAELLITLALGIVAGIAVFTVVGWIWVYAYIYIASAALWGLFFYNLDTSDLDLPPHEDAVDDGIGTPA